MHDQETFEVIQNMGDGRAGIPAIQATMAFSFAMCRSFWRRARIVSWIYENARQFIWQDAEDKLLTESYYYSYNSGIITNWKKGFQHTLGRSLKQTGLHPYHAGKAHLPQRH